MKIAIKNLGAIKQAEFTLGELTIICGGNNTGKTYATYALFGFLSFWRDAFSIKVPDGDIRRLLNEGSIELDIQDYIGNAQTILKNGCKAFTEQLPHVFASSDKHFSESQFSVDLDSSDIQPIPTFERTMGAAKTQLFSISKKTDSPLVTISLLVEKEKVRIPQEVISRIIGDALKDIVFGHLFPHPFIASAERTGAAIFRKELNFARNRLLEEMSSMEKDINPFELLSKVYTDYALPVKSNVDFTRQLEELARKDSFIAKEHPEILNDFTDIIGGDYLVTKNDELYYVPKGNKRIKLTMDESSSAVRSLLDIGFYLRHVAAPGDLLMIDEPELNLHPENQRRVARLFARLVNIGIKVFITTHSDYIIKELNTLIMLNQGGERLRAIADRENYRDSEMLNPDKVRVYIAEEALIKLDGAQRKTKCQTLVQADIDSKLGIEARSFDKTIEDMNRIQEEIVWGGDE
ncbi:MAG: AAA family ATPase [Burkholderiales bacterium]|nr:AAA family ATPase [Burkholderiales bacterium]